MTKVIRMENWVKSGRVVFEICERTDRQTNKQTDRHAILGAPTGDEVTIGTYHIRLVEEAVGCWERVDAGHSAVLQADDDVTPVMLGVATVLTYQHAIRPQRPSNKAHRST